MLSFMKINRFRKCIRKNAGLQWMTLILLFCVNTGSGQTIDSAYLRTKYQFLFRPDSNNLNTMGKDIVVLDLGTKFSKFYSYYKLVEDSMLTAEYNRQNGQNATTLTVTTKGIPRGSSKVVYRNLKTNVYTITQNLVMNNFKYIDSLKNLTWIIQKDTAKISGYNCIRANTKFRGREYNAWFSVEVPVSAGPYLFSGLPGLIVELKDIKGDFAFSLLSIEYFKEKVPIVFNPGKAVLVSRKEFKKLVQMMNEDVLAFAASQGMTLKTKSIDGVENPPPPPKRPYNPMELE